MPVIPTSREAEIGRIAVSRPVQALKVNKIPFQQKSQTWWCIPLIPAMQEPSEVSLGKKHETLPKK
jgi:hypothetical protein